MGEFGLIHRVRQSNLYSPDWIIESIGDDAAVVQCSPGKRQVISTDALVEGVHFNLAYTPLRSLGWKSLAASLSDLAAMGATPLCSVVSLSLPKTWTVDMADTFYEGYFACSKTFNCPLAGGDTTSSKDSAFINVTVFGEADPQKIFLRKGAQKGDLICVSGSLGRSKAALEILEGHYSKKGFENAMQHFLEPTPRFDLVTNPEITKEITAMIDISDGLISDLIHICEASKVGCEIDLTKIPISEEAARWETGRKRNPKKEALHSGEEYQLLFTAHPQFYVRTEMDVQIIGTITDEKEGKNLRIDQTLEPLVPGGWDHFSSH